MKNEKYSLRVKTVLGMGIVADNVKASLERKGFKVAIPPNSRPIKSIQVFA